MFEIPGPASLFSSHFTSTFVGAEELTPNEKLACTNFSGKRLKDFCTGRFCARKALAAMNHEPAEILIGADKQPIWPDGIVGSISHSAELTGAVTCLSTQISSIGLDIETIGKINIDMWQMIFTENEQLFLKSLSPEQIPFYTTLLFSSKESFYKMQYPVTSTFLEFTDVEIRRLGDEFEIKILKEFDQKKSLPNTTPLHHWQQNNQLVTWCYIV
jgi:4'-phosphopantetheinyl transferase EntD